MGDVVSARKMLEKFVDFWVFSSWMVISED